MKDLILTVLISLSAVCAPAVSAAQQHALDSILEDSGIGRMVQCYWLSTGIDVTQSDESSSSKKEEEEEPDCE